MYRIVWRFEVAQERAEEFENEYGPGGAWAALFREGEGFVATRLFRRTDAPGEYLTLDLWESGAAFERFRRERAADYEALDRTLEKLTLCEERIASSEDHSPGCAIRRATAKDVTALSELMRRTFVDAFSTQNRPEDMDAYVRLAYGSAQQQREIEDPDYVTLIVEEEGTPIAFAQVRKRSSPAIRDEACAVEIFRFYVDRPWHGKGVARDLMREASRVAMELGAKSVWLGVWEHNPRAIAFYERCGFRIVGEQTFAIGSDQQTDHVMLSALPVRA